MLAISGTHLGHLWCSRSTFCSLIFRGSSIHPIHTQQSSDSRRLCQGPIVCLFGHSRHPFVRFPGSRHKSDHPELQWRIAGSAQMGSAPGRLCGYEAETNDSVLRLISLSINFLGWPGRLWNSRRWRPERMHNAHLESIHFPHVAVPGTFHSWIRDIIQEICIRSLRLSDECLCKLTGRAQRTFIAREDENRGFETSDTAEKEFGLRSSFLASITDADG
jgi:hypothetical protein